MMLIWSCREASKAVSRSMDEELPFLTRTGMYIHLALCAWCRKYRRHLHFLEHVLKLCPEEYQSDVPEGMSEERKEKMKSALLGKHEH